MDSATKDRIVTIKAMAHHVADEERTRQARQGGPSIASHWNDTLLWLLALLDSLILMEEVDFAFYQARVKDLEEKCGRVLRHIADDGMGGDDRYARAEMRDTARAALQEVLGQKPW